MMKRLTADDPETRSADLIAENLERMRTLFPEAFTEGKIDFDVLKQLLGGAVEERQEKFGLNWHGKRQARQLALTPSTGTLRPCPEESVNWETTQNLMIEGDNLEVMKLLQRSYAGRVDLIYIDPPYNTGKDFVYQDSFEDSISHYLIATGQADGISRLTSSNPDTDGRYHTNWLNMMHPRISAARCLLTQNGVIMISIDDAELPSLRQICDEIFGHENFIGCIIRNTNSSKNQSLQFSISHDYAVCYARDNHHLLSTLRERGAWSVPKNNLDAYMKHVYELIEAGLSDDELTQELKELTKRPRFIDFVNYWHADQHVRIRGIYRKGDLGGVSNGNPKPILNPITGCLDPVPPGGFRFPPDKLDELIRQDRVHFHIDGSLPTIKRYLLENTHSRPKGIMSDDQRPDYALLSKYGITFDNPKQLDFLERIIGLAGPDACVLDFFADSGSTAEAVMRLNSKDGGRRRFILVQIPQPTCGPNKFHTISEITKHRIRMAGRSEACNNMVRSMNGFRSFALGSSNIQAWEPDPGTLSQALEATIEHLKADRTDQDILFELLLKLGLDLCVPIETRKIEAAGNREHEIHSVGGGSLLACLSTDIPMDDVTPVAHGMVEWHGQLQPAGDTTCVFRDSAFPNDVAKTNMASILEQNGIRFVRSL